MAIPGLLCATAPAQTLAKQWSGIFARGKVQGPMTALLSLAAYGCLAYDGSSRGQRWTPHLIAGGLTIAIVPFTLLFMAPTNNLLLGAANGTAAHLDEEAVKALLLKWKNLNLTRALFPLCGSVVGLWSILS